MNLNYTSHDITLKLGNETHNPIRGDEFGDSALFVGLFHTDKDRLRVVWADSTYSLEAGMQVVFKHHLTGRKTRAEFLGWIEPADGTLVGAFEGEWAAHWELT